MRRKGKMSRRDILSAVTVISSLLAGGSTRAEIVQLIAVRDNTLFETESGEISNGSGPVAFVGNTGALNARRALFFFDVMSAVPESSTVQSVELRLHLSNASNSDSTLVEVHRVLADWGEGASNSSGGTGASSEPGDATWLHTFYPDQFWTNLGGDFEIDASAQTFVQGIGDYSWSGPGLIDDVQSWVDHSRPEYGWLLQGNEVTPNTARRFDTHENIEPAFHPMLVIEYEPPNTAVEAVSWGRIKTFYRLPAPME